MIRFLHLWLHAMRREGHLRGWRTLPVLWRQALYVWRSRPYVERHWWRIRMRACMRCPIYVHATKQCGSRFAHGCGCVMPLKNLFRGTVCWARETGRTDFGWPPGVI